MFECFSVQLDGREGCVAAGATACGFLGVLRVRRRVGAQEKLAVAAGGGVQQGDLMGIALEDRQAIEVRTNTANQHVIAVVQQVMRGDGRADVSRSLVDELHGIGGGDVFEHHFECRETLDHAAHVFVDKDFLAIEHVDVAAGHFAVDQQRHANFGHRFEHREDLVDTGHAGVGVGGGAGRVQLGGVHEAAGLGGADVFGLSDVGEVKHHQRLEAAALRASGEDALTIGIGLLRVAYRRHEVRHDDGAAKGARNVSDGMGQNGAITKMDMPVVGAQEGQAVGHWGIPGGQTRWECYRKRLIQALAIKFCRKLPIDTCKR